MNNQANLTEQELLNDLLNEEKHLMSLYSIAISETACPELCSLLNSQYQQISNDRYCVFDAMSKKGFYPIKQAQQAEVDQAKQKMCQTQKQLNII